MGVCVFMHKRMFLINGTVDLQLHDNIRSNTDLVHLYAPVNDIYRVIELLYILLAAVYCLLRPASACITTVSLKKKKKNLFSCMVL